LENSTKTSTKHSRSLDSDKEDSNSDNEAPVVKTSRKRRHIYNEVELVEDDVEPGHKEVEDISDAEEVS
jgi:hypothetical protein